MMNPKHRFRGQFIVATMLMLVLVGGWSWAALARLDRAPMVVTPSPSVTDLPATSTPSPTSTNSPTPDATLQAITNLALVKSDDFSFSGTGWDNYEDQSGQGKFSVGYRSGEYFIELNKYPSLFFAILATEIINDGVLQVKSLGPFGKKNASRQGIAWGYQNPTNYGYSFSIDEAGYCYLKEHTGDTNLVQQPYYKIEGFDAEIPHILTVVINGDTATGYVNNVFCGRYTMENYIPGKVGLVASSPRGDGKSYFDDFKLYQARRDIVGASIPADIPRPTHTPSVMTDTSIPSSDNTPVSSTETLVPTNTSSPTETPTPAETSTPVPTVTPTIVVVDSTIELLNPINNHVFSNNTESIDFQWQYGDSCDLPEELGFELRIWKPEETPLGAMSAVHHQKQITCHNGERTFTVGNFEVVPGVGGTTSGQFLWDVLLVRIAPSYNSIPLVKAEGQFELGGAGGNTSGPSGPIIE
ncbi:hypothetical protein QUF63_16095 [Anaerolineales bacterium HSG25]|nr:hypothetical protein [Anaerolineales bacterium HSG25]